MNDLIEVVVTNTAESGEGSFSWALGQIERSESGGTILFNNVFEIAVPSSFTNNMTGKRLIIDGSGGQNGHVVFRPKYDAGLYLKFPLFRFIQSSGEENAFTFKNLIFLSFQTDDSATGNSLRGTIYNNIYTSREVEFIRCAFIGNYSTSRGLVVLNGGLLKFDKCLFLLNASRQTGTNEKEEKNATAYGNSRAICALNLQESGASSFKQCTFAANAGNQNSAPIYDGAGDPYFYQTIIDEETTAAQNFQDLGVNSFAFNNYNAEYIAELFYNGNIKPFVKNTAAAYFMENERDEEEDFYNVITPRSKVAGAVGGTFYNRQALAQLGGTCATVESTGTHYFEYGATLTIYNDKRYKDISGQFNAQDTLYGTTFSTVSTAGVNSAGVVGVGGADFKNNFYSATFENICRAYYNDKRIDTYFYVAQYKEDDLYKIELQAVDLAQVEGGQVFGAWSFSDPEIGEYNYINTNGYNSLELQEFSVPGATIAARLLTVSGAFMFFNIPREYFYIGNQESGSFNNPLDWSLTEGGEPSQYPISQQYAVFNVNI